MGAVVNFVVVVVVFDGATDGVVVVVVVGVVKFSEETQVCWKLHCVNPLNFWQTWLAQQSESL